MDNFERRVLLVLALANIVIMSLLVLRNYFLPRIKAIRITRKSSHPEYRNKDVTIEKIVTPRA